MVQALMNSPLIIRRKMIKHLIPASLAFLTFCFSSPCRSKEIYTFGVGKDSCVSYVSRIAASPGNLVGRPAPDDRQDLQSTIYLEWLLGFVSGYNATLNDPTRRVQVDEVAVDRYVRWWCGQNRAGNISAAVQQFLDGDVP